MIRNFGTGELDPDTYVSEGTLNAALHAAGAVMEAVEQCKQGAIERAFCLVRPPGHHAEADRAMGFCIFNNVAIGARYARSLGYSRVFIIDFDAHHGNGTQHIFEEDDRFYFSTHHIPIILKRARIGSAAQAGAWLIQRPDPLAPKNKEYLAVYQTSCPASSAVLTRTSSWSRPAMTSMSTTPTRTSASPTRASTASSGAS
jgi:acetoin utilization deacetylase AcuC-like enzyme